MSGLSLYSKESKVAKRVEGTTNLRPSKPSKTEGSLILLRPAASPFETSSKKVLV